MLRFRLGDRWPFAVPLAALVVGWLFFLPGVHTFPLDDAYIHLAYVRTLADSGVLGLNPGEPSMGTSSQLWVYILTALRLVHLQDDYWSVQLVSLFLLGGTVVAVTGTVRDATRRFLSSQRDAEAAGVLAGCLVALSGDVQWMGGSGMETPLALFLPFLAIWLFARRGFGVVVGILCGLTFGTRTPGVVLAFVLLGLDLARGQWRRCFRGCVASGLTALPFVIVSLRITGGIVPTSAQGKLLTYVGHGIDLDGILHFTGRFIALQKYLPHSIVLAACALVGGGIALGGPERLRSRIARALVDYPEYLATAGFGLAHFAAYAFGFRTLGQQGRYLVEEQVVLVILGVIGLAVTMTHWIGRRVAIAVGAAALLCCTGGLPYWRRVYADNVKQVDEVYLRMGRWIAANTPPDARVAAFDIGVLRYVGNRYAIDLGGLVDPEAHDCLRRRDCGPYARRKGATYVLFSKEPEADNITGVYWSETAPGLVLRQSPMVEFRYPDYEAPTLTHSLRLTLTHVDGWMARGSAALDRSFVAPEGATYVPVSAAAGEGFDLVGAHLDVDGVLAMRDYPYFFELTLYYRVRDTPPGKRWVHLAFFDDVSGRIVQSYHDLVTRDLLDPSEWPVGRVMKDEHLFFIPYGAPGRLWHLRVAFTDTQLFDDKYPGLYRWTDIGDFTNDRSAMNPLAPL